MINYLKLAGDILDSGLSPYEYLSMNGYEDEEIRDIVLTLREKYGDDFF